MTMQEWSEYDHNRSGIISENRSRRMRHPQQPPLPVPPKVEKPHGYCVDTKDGGYVGFWPIDDLDEVRELVAEFHDPNDCVFTRQERLR